MELTEAGTSRRRIPRWPFWAGGVILALLATVAVLVDIAAHRAEPFVRQQVVQALSDRFHARVELDSFHLIAGQYAARRVGRLGRGERPAHLAPGRCGGRSCSGTQSADPAADPARRVSLSRALALSIRTADSHHADSPQGARHPLSSALAYAESVESQPGNATESPSNALNVR